VSPVIGVILMVAITVILAAVIGAFVLQLGDQASNTAPQASVDFEFQGTDNVTITHNGGDNLENDTISIIIENDANSPYNTTGWGDGGDITAGDSIDMDNYHGLSGISSGDTVSVVWNGDGGSSSTIASRDFP